MEQKIAIAQDYQQLQNRKEQLESEILQLVEQAEELNREHVELKNEAWLLQKQLETAMPRLALVRDRILKSLTSGKGKVATTSPQYKTASRVLDKFIGELQKSTPPSTPISTPPFTPERINTPDSHTWQSKAESFLNEVKWNG